MLVYWRVTPEGKPPFSSLDCGSPAFCDLGRTWAFGSSCRAAMWRWDSQGSTGVTGRSTGGVFPVSSVFQWFQSSQFWWFNSNCFNDSIIPIVWLIPILQTISMIKVIAITRMSSKYPCCYRHCYSNCSNCSNDSTFSWGILDHEVYKLFLLNEGRSELKRGQWHGFTRITTVWNPQ